MSIGTKTHQKGINIKSKYSNLIVSDNHKLMVWSGNNIIEKKAIDITENDNIVSFCKVNAPLSRYQELSEVENEEYVRISESGKYILKEASVGDSLREFD